MENKLLAQIEAILFYLNEPVEIKYLAKKLEVKENEIQEAIKLSSNENRGISLITNDKTVTLATNPNFGSIIQKIAKEEERRPLSKASLETLSIVLYKNGITKHELDEIRGVNCAFSLRNLSVRGLIEKKENKKDKRSPIYVPTTDTLAFLGVSKTSELENFDLVQKKIEEIKNSFEPE